MNPKLKSALWLAGIAAAAYLGYRWWSSRQSSQGLGSNLGSVGYLTGGSTGPDSGLNYYQGSTNVTVTQPVTSGGVTAGPVSGEPGPYRGPGNPPPGPGPVPKKKQKPVWKPSGKRPVTVPLEWRPEK